MLKGWNILLQVSKSGDRFIRSTLNIHFYKSMCVWLCLTRGFLCLTCEIYVCMDLPESISQYLKFFFVFI